MKDPMKCSLGGDSGDVRVMSKIPVVLFGAWIFTCMKCDGSELAICFSSPTAVINVSYVGISTSSPVGCILAIASDTLPLSSSFYLAKTRRRSYSRKSERRIDGCFA